MPALADILVEVGLTLLLSVGFDTLTLLPLTILDYYFLILFK